MKKMLAAVAAVVAVGSLATGSASASTTSSLWGKITSNRLTYLTSALTATGLDDVMKDCEAGPITVFGPTNAAFEALFAALGIDPNTPEGEAAIAALVEDGTLEAILLYHAVPGAVMSTDLTESTVSTLLTGKKVQFTESGGAWYVNNAKITKVDIEACNGVLHIIDAVLLPSDGDLGGDTGSGTTMAMLAAALLGAGLLVTAISRRRVTA
ncbi:MAG: fasciclin domain-containing protein [Ilumatobacteraceae bacterium]